MSNTSISGTTYETEVVRAVDGDTIIADVEGEDEYLRLLALDTEESSSAGGKPVTPWGKKAKERATESFPEGSAVTLEFPGTEPLDECLERYRDNYGRLLVYAHDDDGDFQERMIREGYSPYFTKYGYAEFDDHHRRYREAERQAQANAAGLWDQLAVNGAEMRDYDSLCPWWELRAEVVESFREASEAGTEEVFDSRLDYDTLLDREGEETTVFTELRSYQQVGQGHVVVSIGSREQPFKLFLPNAVESADGQRVLSLLDRRYVPVYDGATVESPRRSYAYVTGPIKMYRKEPEIEVTSTDQIADAPPSE